METDVGMRWIRWGEVISNVWFLFWMGILRKIVVFLQTKQTYGGLVQRCHLRVWRRQWQEHVERFDSIRCERQILGTCIRHRNSTSPTLSSFGSGARQFNVRLRRIHGWHSFQLESNQQERPVWVQIPEWSVGWVEIRWEVSVCWESYYWSQLRIWFFSPEHLFHGVLTERPFTITNYGMSSSLRCGQFDWFSIFFQDLRWLRWKCPIEWYVDHVVDRW